MVELTLFDYYNGTLSIIHVAINFIVGFVLIYKYFEYRNKQLLYMGLTMLFLTSVWFTHSVAFVLILTTGEGLSPEIFFIMAYPLTAVASVLWMVVITNLIYKEKNKLIISIYIIYGIVFEILFFILLFDNTDNIAILENPIEPAVSRFMQIHLLFVLITSLVTGFLFFRESKKSSDPEIKLKGKLFMISVSLFVIGSIIDTFSLSIAIILIVRVVLMIGALFIYWAFVTPKWLRRFVSDVEILDDDDDDDDDKKDDVGGFLKMLKAKPKMITEQEITFYKERKLCLVCKGDASGFTFICPKCDALYCKKCVDALIPLENMCWACNDPLDKSKPTKPYEMVEEKEDIVLSGLKESPKIKKRKK